MNDVVKKDDLYQAGGESSSPAKTPLEQLEENCNKMIDDPSYDPMAGPATMFGMYGPLLFSCVDRLSNRQLKRLIKALCVWPIEDYSANRKNTVEYEAFKIGNKMLEAKYLLKMVHSMQEIEKKGDTNAKQEKIHEGGGNLEQREGRTELDVGETRGPEEQK